MTFAIVGILAFWFGRPAVPATLVPLILDATGSPAHRTVPGAAPDAPAASEDATIQDEAAQREWYTTVASQISADIKVCGIDPTGMSMACHGDVCSIRGTPGWSMAHEVRSYARRPLLLVERLGEEFLDLPGLDSCEHSRRRPHYFVPVPGVDHACVAYGRFGTFPLDTDSGAVATMLCDRLAADAPFR